MTSDLVTTTRLLTIPFSHYCEKARWALDRAAVPYVEDAYLPGLHVPPTRRAGGRTVPVLIREDAVLTDSSAILDHADRCRPGAIWPVDPVDLADARSLVEGFDEALGIASRQLAYHYLLPVPEVFLKVVAASSSARERALLRVGLPLLRPFLRRRYDVAERSVANAAELVDAAFARVAARLTDGRQYLVADALTGADLAFASLASPLLLPPGHPVYDGSRIDMLPPAMGALVRRLRAHPAGRHALRMYADHRR